MFDIADRDREGIAVVRLGAMVVAMEVAALAVAYLTFGWPVLLPGALLLVGTALVLAVVLVSEGHRRRQHRAARTEPAAEPLDDLMSGYFTIPTQPGSVSVPDSARPAR